MPNAPYRRLKRAEQNARREHPQATRIKVLWTPACEHEIHVEVWSNDGAKVVPA